MIELKVIEGDPQLGEIAARNFAKENGLKFISPYNDLEIIEGQGTCGLEILRQCLGFCSFCVQHFHGDCDESLKFLNR